MKQLMEQITAYTPFNEQEERDKRIILNFLSTAEHPFTRENEIAHMTASSWIVNPERTRVLMIYHNIYQSWSWTGGHADGQTDLRAVAVKEAKEETGIEDFRLISEELFSLETIVVEGHVKRGAYVASHLHMNLTYLLEASEESALRIKEDENSGVKWLPIDDLASYVSEPWMLERVYQKLNEKMRRL